MVFRVGIRDLDSVISKDQVLGAREEVRNDLQPSQWLVRIANVLAHRFALSLTLGTSRVRQRNGWMLWLGRSHRVRRSEVFTRRGNSTAANHSAG